MASLTLIRGLPGSGKTTMAKQMLEGGLVDVHFEADQYFEKDGEYKYIPEEIRSAHEWCQASAHSCLELGQRVVVSNTFTQKWEMLPYMLMAEQLECDIKIIVTRGEYKNIHNIPEEVMIKMKERWEE